MGTNKSGSTSRSGANAPPLRRFGPRGPRRVGDLARESIEPALLRRAGLTLTLLGRWQEIAGPELAARSRPVRIKWGRRPHAAEAAAPGTLIVACDGASALRLQHETTQVMERVNAAFGYAAIGRISIEQRAIGEPRPAQPKRAVPPDRCRDIDRSVAGIEDDELRETLRTLGRRVAEHSRSGGDAR